MSITKRADARVAVLVFPFAAPNVLSFAGKLAIAVQAVTKATVLVGGSIPPSFVLSDEIQVRDIGVRLHYLATKRPVVLSALLWIGKALVAQMRLAQEVFRLRHQIDIVICSMGPYYQLPIIVARLLNKQVLSTSWGLPAVKAQMNYGRTIGVVVSLLTRCSFALSQGILIDSPRLAASRELAPFRSKLFNGALFLEDREHFRAQSPVSERPHLVAFIGRLVVEKGVLDLAQAIPLVLEQRPEISFLIIGTGRLDALLERSLRGQAWRQQVTWLRWVDHAQISHHLNRVRLLVVPSYEEGLPNIILEAIGCGTPVLATAVGGIPDLIVESETGFLLQDSRPTTIAKRILECIDDPRLARMTERAQRLIDQDYSLDAAVRRYEHIIQAVKQGADQP